MSTAVLEREQVEFRPAPGGGAAASADVAGSPAAEKAGGDTLFSSRDRHVFLAVYVAALLLLLLIVLAMRLAHPAAFGWGQKLMNIPLAAAGIGALLLSAAAAGVAAPLTRVGAARGAAMALLVAFLGCGAFVAVTLIDRDAKSAYGIRPGERFKPNERYVARAFGVKLPKKKPVYVPTVAVAENAPAARSIDAINGRRLFLGTCAGCHGPDANGMPGQGKSLIESEYVKSKSDVEMLKFVQVGRQPWDPLNTTRVQMPPRGGNPTLVDADLNDVVAYLRTLQNRGGTADSAASGEKKTAASGPTLAVGGAGSAAEPVFIEKSVIPPAPAGPNGMGADYFTAACKPRWAAPADAVSFADTYYLLTSCQALQAGVLAAAALALAVLAWRNRLDATRPQAVVALAALTGMAALFWLVTAPLTYFV
ncbi:Cytochrome c [Phycisphaerae bacterium RAS1]|nr:Cytochrome c [Phycisphaerae bacterium RAS1]